jgi:hydroxyacylglutathione hydrolase
MKMRLMLGGPALAALFGLTGCWQAAVGHAAYNRATGQPTMLERVNKSLNGADDDDYPRDRDPVSGCEGPAAGQREARVQIIAFELGPAATNAYLLLPPGRDEAVLIDAPPGAGAAIAPHLEGRRLAAVLLTHGHWDHMGGAAELRAAGATIYAHAADRTWIEDPGVQGAFMGMDLRIKPVTVDELLTPGQTLELAGLRAEVRHVPGHAPGNVLFYFPALGAAFSGDAIMAGTVGRTDLPGGDFEQLEKSIREQIYTLPGETVLCPGHGPATTVAEERAGNPYVHG